MKQDKISKQVERLKRELKAAEEKIKSLENSSFNDELYGVKVCIWEGGSGSGSTDILCKDLQTAIIVKEGLGKVYPNNFDSSCGDEEIKREVKIEVEAMFNHEIEDFVKKDRW